MNFATVPTIPAAIIARASHPLYGYFLTPDAYYDAIIGWQRDRNGVEGLTKDAIGYENGVLGGVAAALGCLAAPGDAVLLHSPTYIGFTHTLEDNGYRIVHSPLVQDRASLSAPSCRSRCKTNILSTRPSSATTPNLPPTPTAGKDRIAS